MIGETSIVDVATNYSSFHISRATMEHFDARAVAHDFIAGAAR